MRLLPSPVGRAPELNTAAPSVQRAVLPLLRIGTPILILFGLFPSLRKLYADGGYQGPVFREALARVLPRTSIPDAQ